MMAVIISPSKSLLYSSFRLSQVVPVRSAIGSPGQSQGKPRVGKDWRVKFSIGTRIREKQIVATQLNLNYHPGLNVGLDHRDNSLYAMVPGTLLISSEESKPDLTHDVAAKYYTDRKPGLKRFVHVVGRKPGIQFRLVDLI